MNAPAPRTWSGPNRTGQTQVNMQPQIQRRLLTVTRIEDLAPRYRRMWFTGPALADGFPWIHLAVADHVKVVFPREPGAGIELPTGPAGGLSREELAARPPMRDYTVRAWLPETQELALDFIMHDSGGVAADWAASARPGSELGVMGPRANVIYPENYSLYVLAGDETAIPAIRRFTEELPAGVEARLVLSVANAAEKQDLDLPEGMELTWVDRSTEGVEGLERAVRNLSLPAGDDWYVFAAGEVGELRPLREYFRQELGLPKERVHVSGYWRRGTVNLDHHNTGLED